MTKVVVYQIAGRDYPAQFKNNEKFLNASASAIRRRLELRPQDEVVIIEGEGKE